MINGLDRYLADNPELKKVSDCKDSDLLEWADRKRYIRLRKFEGKLLYTESQLEDAKMWAEKDASSKTLLKPFKLMVLYNQPEAEFVTYSRYRTEGDAIAIGHRLLEDKSTGVIEFEVVED